MNNEFIENSEEKKQSRSPADQDEQSFRRVVSSGIVILVVLAVFLLFVLLLAVQFGQGFWLNIALNHFPVIIGLPVSAAGAFLIVMLLRNTEGPLEFEGLGFKFKGASGPVVLWAMCFLVIASAIRMLWPLSTHWGG